MNKKQYNNVIDYTLTHEAEAQSADSLKTARAVFNNMGVALPNGEISEVYETLKTNDYMGWKSCTMQEAQKAADSGTAAIGISKDRIVILSAADEEDPVTQTASVMTISETTPAVAVSDLEYYSYSYYTTEQGGSSTTVFPRNLTLSMLKQKFPHGKYWNHAGMDENNQSGYTEIPCNHALHGTDYCNCFSLAGVDYSWQCMGFAERCGYDASGYNPRYYSNGSWKIYRRDASKIDTLKAGDIVQYLTKSNPIKYHSIYITNVSGENITYGDCNYYNTCQIRWDVQTTKSALKALFDKGGEYRHVRVAPTPLLP